MNDNETADQLYADIAGRAVANENDSKEAATRSIANICKWLSERGFSRVADEIFAAHKREIAAKDDERLTVIANYEVVMAEKDAEIVQLKACRDGGCERIRLGAEPCKGCHWQMSADAYDKLRSLVKELADALNDATAMACKGEYCNKHSFCPDCQATKNRALVAKAREVIGGEE